MEQSKPTWTYGGRSHGRRGAVSAPPHGQDSPPARPLTADEVARARATHGSNTLSAKKRRSFLRQFLGNLNDPIIPPE